ncbi:MAG: Rieske 2Fe-2S domain-containing protein [Thermoguttaceae bacterium]
MSKQQNTSSSTDDSRLVEQPDSVKTSSVSLSPQTSEKRRDFLKVSVASGVGLCALGAPLGAGTVAVLAPVFQESATGKFYPVTSAESLSEVPQKFQIVDDIRDAWATRPNQKIGSIFLRKINGNVQAFHADCPHAGCMVQVGVRTVPGKETEEVMFYCPCHSAHFDLEGVRIDKVSPRDLDSLEVKVENGIVSVKLQNFVFGISEKRPS